MTPPDKQLSSKDREFDGFADQYDDLLADPLRDRFGGESKFFHQRKLDVLLAHLLRSARNPKQLELLDLGCGKGDLLRLASEHFFGVHGCDVSAASLKYCDGISVKVQEDPESIPYSEGSFDLVTAACVFHHVKPCKRNSLISEMVRVLKPGGLICIFEHNPFNPVTQMIVKRSPVDVNAILLSSGECARLLAECGLSVDTIDYYLFFPRIVPWAVRIEPHLARLPLGGQYAVIGSMGPQYRHNKA